MRAMSRAIIIAVMVAGIGYGFFAKFFTSQPFGI
jgi:hypothetical protein